MPTLFRFLAVSLILAGLGYAALIALAAVEPQPREMSISVPPSRFAPQK